MEQSKFIIFRMEPQEDGQTRLTFTLKGTEGHLTIDYQVTLGWRLPLYHQPSWSKTAEFFEFECVGFRFEGDETMYKYPIRYKDAMSSLRRLEFTLLTDDLETERAIEAVFVPWNWKERGRE